MKKKETKLYWQLKEANRFVLICLFIGWLFDSIFALICATVVFIHSFLVSVFSPLPPSPSVCGMASYTTVGRALEPQKPELSVDDMLSEEFGQEYGKRECLSTAEALALLLKDQQNKRGERSSGLIESEVFTKTLEYVKAVNVYPNPEERQSELEGIKTTLQSMEFPQDDLDAPPLRLTNPEIAMLCNLLPRDYDEAVTLVPSLVANNNRFSKSDIEEIIRFLDKSYEEAQ